MENVKKRHLKEEIEHHKATVRAMRDTLKRLVSTRSKETDLIEDLQNQAAEILRMTEEPWMVR